MKQITLLVTDKQHKKLKECSREMEVRMSELVRRAIEKCYLEKLDGKE